MSGSEKGRLETGPDGKRRLIVPPDPRVARLEAVVSELSARPAVAPPPAQPPVVLNLTDMTRVVEASDRATLAAQASAGEVKALREVVGRALEDAAQRSEAASAQVVAAIGAGFASLVEAIRSIKPTINLPAPVVTQAANPPPVVNVIAKSGPVSVLAEVVLPPRKPMTAEIKNPDGTVSKITTREAGS